MIIRVFRAIIRPGKHQEYEHFLHEKAIPLVRSQPGVIDTFIGRPIGTVPDEYVFISTWRDVEALKQFAGDEWEKAVIEPELVPLLQTCFMHHYEQL